MGQNAPGFVFGLNFIRLMAMWPLDLPGPQFLLVYLVVGWLVLLALFLLRHAAESEDTPKVNLADPYLIAFLRGGKNESLRVAAMSLVDRAILTADGTKLVAVEAAFGKATNAVEQAVVKHFNPSAEASSLFKMKEADDVMSRYEQELTRLGLLPDAEVKSARALRMGVALVVLITLASVKIGVALSTGHTNIQFLCILMVIFAVIAVVMSRPRRTKAGDRMVEDLRTLFGGLKERSSQIQNGASPAEFALMAGVFGMATVPYAKKLFPQAGGSSGCGSSCGSGGDGGGSSCGGGGCGGCGGS